MRNCFPSPLATLLQAASVLVAISHAGTSLAQVNAEKAPTTTQFAGSTDGKISPTVGPKVGPLEVGGQVGSPSRRTSLDIVTPRAQAHIDYALDLAQRGAVDSAQAEFRTALELIADAQDADTNDASRAHVRALKAGLTAIEESKDFVSSETGSDLDTNLAQFSAIHRTPILKESDATKLTRAAALQRYHFYATKQLAFAGGHSTIASNALYGLGRAESITTAGSGVRNPLGGPNAIALYQAALCVDPQNYLACNELGVLMARYGDLSAAEEQFLHSLTVHPQPETWHNLAAVFRASGQAEKAAQAEVEREKLITAIRERGPASADATDLASRPVVQWIEPETFASSSTPYGLDGPAIDSSTSGKVAASVQPDSIKTRVVSKLSSWLKPGKTAAPVSSTPAAGPPPASSKGTYVAERTLYR